MTDREREIVASFKPWVKAFKRGDDQACGAIEKVWHEDAWRLELGEKLRAAALDAWAKKSRRANG